MRKLTPYFIRHQFPKNKYDRHEPTTTTELQATELEHTNKVCGKVKHVHECPNPTPNQGHGCDFFKGDLGYGMYHVYRNSILHIYKRQFHHHFEYNQHKLLRNG